MEEGIKYCYLRGNGHKKLAPFGEARGGRLWGGILLEKKKGHISRKVKKKLVQTEDPHKIICQN